MLSGIPYCALMTVNDLVVGMRAPVAMRRCETAV